MAKTLRTLSDPDFTTKGNTLTFSELDQNFIDLWNEIVDNQRLDDLTPTDANFVVGDGTDWVTESGATARASLGLADQSADLDLNSISINGTDLFPDDEPQALGTGDSPTFAGLTATDDVDITGTTQNALNVAGPSGGNTVIELGIQGEGSLTTLDFHTGATNVDYDSRIQASGGDGTTEGGSLRLLASQTAIDTKLVVNATTFSGSETFRNVGDTRLEGEVDVTGNLTVQGGLFASEMVVDRERVFFSHSLSPGGGKVSSVTGSAGSETITFEDVDGSEFVPVAADDIIWIKERTGLNSGTIVKNIRRKVASISGTDVTLTDTGITWDSGTDDVGSIAVGDDAVVKGNTTNTARDGYIDFVVQADMPYQSFWDEVDDIGGGTEVMRIGGMNGFDAGITGDIGIAGATKADGAVFWITEDEAKIGSFNIEDDRLFSTTNSGLIEINTGSSSRRFLISPDGDLSGATGSFINMFYVNSGTWGLRGQVSGDRVFELGDTNRIAGSYFDATDLWGGNATKSNATVRLDFANGQIFYDAMGSVVYSRSALATFGRGNTVSSSNLEDQEWSALSTLSGTGEDPPSEEIKAVIKWQKKFGIEKINLIGNAKAVTSTDGLSVVFTDNVIARVSGDFNQQSINNSSYTQFELELDVTGLTDGNFYTIELALEVGINASDGSSHSNELFLREDILILDGTG